MNCNLRVGNGFDVHQLAKGYRLILGGVEIKHEKGSVAHSDGDVMLHSLCDALLGALALGDIGHHFPDTSNEFKGIDSRILLTRVYDMVKANGYELVNADITLLMQKPRIAPFIPEIRKSVASVLKVDVSAVSVKATTTEHLGYEGREEGVSCYSTVLLSR